MGNVIELSSYTKPKSVTRLKYLQIEGEIKRHRITIDTLIDYRDKLENGEISIGIDKARECNDMWETTTREMHELNGDEFIRINFEQYVK